MKIEVLFPEFSNLFGDFSNIKYLEKSVKDAEIIYTNNFQKPYFLDNKVDMVYMGSMPESKQEAAIKILMPYKEQLWELINKGQVFLVTGNALEIFIKHIVDGDKKIDALGFFDLYAERDFEHRHNSHFLGSFEDMKIAGYKSQFTMCYGENKFPFIDVIGGCGLNKEAKTEGIHYNNFFATYLLGPFLVVNPYFTKYFLRLMGCDDSLAFEKEAVEAYDYRISKMLLHNRYIMGEHG